MGFFPSVDVSKQYVRGAALLIGACVLFLAMRAIGADAQQSAYTRNQSCAPVQNAVNGEYDTSIQCQLELVRPATDTGSDVIRLGIFFPAEFPGVTAWSAQGFVCSQQAQAGMPTRLLCTGGLQKGASIPVAFTLHLKGTCGTDGGIRSQVNQDGTLSAPTDTLIPFPACGDINAGANTSVQNSAGSLAQNNTGIVQMSAGNGSQSSSSSSRRCYYCESQSSRSSRSSFFLSSSSLSSFALLSSSSSSATSVSSSSSSLTSASSLSSASSMMSWSSVSVSGSYQCSDNIDNDGDGATDQYDFSCFGPYDNDENIPMAACQDLQDNDGDSLIDRQDSGCLYPQDNDESNQVAQNYGTPDVNVNVNNYSSQQPYLITYNPQTIIPANASSSQSSQPEVAGFRQMDTLVAAGSGFPGSVTMTKRADKAEARPGDTMWYTITVRNNSESPITGLTLDDRFTPSDFIVTEAGGGATGDGYIQWLNGNLQPRETKAIRYQVRLSDGLANKHVVRNTATLSGGGLSSPLSSTAEVGIMRQMPATGAIKLKPLVFEEQTEQGFSSSSFFQAIWEFVF